MRTVSFVAEHERLLYQVSKTFYNFILQRTENEYHYEKKSLNIDCQQFHQYQQNEPPPHLKSLNTNMTTACDVGDPNPDLGEGQNVEGLNILMG